MNFQIDCKRTKKMYIKQAFVTKNIIIIKCKYFSTFVDICYNSKVFCVCNLFKIFFRNELLVGFVDWLLFAVQ